MKLFKGKRTAPRHAVRSTSDQKNTIVKACVRAAFFGAATSFLLLAAGAAVFATFPVPAGLTRPAASLIAGIGTAVAGAVLASGVGRQRLLCGLGCGVLAAICLALASFVTGGLILSDINIAMLCVLVFSGMFGGTITALRPARQLH